MATIFTIGIVILVMGVIVLAMYDNECKLEEEREIRELLLRKLEEEES